MKKETLNFLYTIYGTNIFCIPMQAHVNGNLEMIFLLAHKRFIRHREIEAFICIHSVLWRWSGNLKIQLFIQSTAFKVSSNR